MCVRSSSDETGRSRNTEIQYANSVALAPVEDERSRTTVADGDQCQAVYQDLNIGAGSAVPIVYEKIKPSVLPKPARSSDMNYLSLYQ